MWIEKHEVQGKHGTYVVSKSDTGEWGCSCPVWKFHREECKHIKFVKSGGVQQQRLATPRVFVKKHTRSSAPRAALSTMPDIGLIQKPAIASETSSRVDLVPVMLAAPDGHTHMQDPGWVAEEKFDGTRCVLYKAGDSVRIFGRSGNEYTSRYPDIVEEGQKIRGDCVLDGELTFFSKQTGRDEFLTSLVRRETWEGRLDLKLMVFDIVSKSGHDVTQLPLMERKRLLKQTIPLESKILAYVDVFEPANKQPFYDKITSPQSQGEGIILKRRDSTYQPGIRSVDWLKMKAWKSDEAIVVGLSRGLNRRAATFGAAVLAAYDGRKLRYVGKTSGFSDAQLLEMLAKCRRIEVSAPLLRQEDVRHVPDPLLWCKPELVVEVKFLERTKNKIFRHPDFLRFRDDKKLAEVKW